jgi:hypothetical protein
MGSPLLRLSNRLTPWADKTIDAQEKFTTARLCESLNGADDRPCKVPVKGSSKVPRRDL